MDWSNQMTQSPYLISRKRAGVAKYLANMTYGDLDKFVDELYKLSPSMPRTVVTALYENIKQREAEDGKV